MIVHAYHGWASDASIWDQVALLLGPQVMLRRFERGYFGLEHDVPHDEQPDVILTHSMGLLFAPDTTFAAARRILVVNGFSFFPSSDPKSQRRTLSMLALMKSNLQRDPVAQVHSFCLKAGMQLPNISTESINIARLTTDLDLLATVSVTPHQFNSEAIIHFVHSINDPIVNSMAIQDTLTTFPRAEHHQIESEMHNLPDMNADMVRKLIFMP